MEIMVAMVAMVLVLFLMIHAAVMAAVEEHNLREELAGRARTAALVFPIRRDLMAIVFGEVWAELRQLIIITAMVLAAAAAVVVVIMAAVVAVAVDMLATLAPEE